MYCLCMGAFMAHFLVPSTLKGVRDVAYIEQHTDFTCCSEVLAYEGLRAPLVEWIGKKKEGNGKFVLEVVAFRCRQETEEGCGAAGRDSGAENGEAQKTRNSKHGFMTMMVNRVMMMTMMTMMKVCERGGVLTLTLGLPYGSLMPLLWHVSRNMSACKVREYGNQKPETGTRTTTGMNDSGGTFVISPPPRVCVDSIPDGGLLRPSRAGYRVRMCATSGGAGASSAQNTEGGWQGWDSDAALELNVQKEDRRGCETQPYDSRG